MKNIRLFVISFFVIIGFGTLQAGSYNMYNNWFLINNFLFNQQFFHSNLLLYPEIYSLLMFQPLDNSFQDLDSLTNVKPIIQEDNYFNARPTFLKRPEIFRENYFNFDTKDLNKKNPKGYRIYSKLDTSVTFFESGEFLDSLELNPTYSTELDTYLENRRNKIKKQVWDSLTKTYDVKQAVSQGDLTRMIGQSTGIAIPVPPNPIFSLFGKPEIAINVSGEANVTVGWRWDSQNLELFLNLDKLNPPLFLIRIFALM